jgi:hypothetical protein
MSVAPRRSYTDFAGVFGFFAYAILVIVFALALGIFFYARVLAASQSTQDAALAKVEATINPATVNSFVQLRDRLVSSKTLLANHVAFSEFFTLLGTLMPTTVRFSSLQLSTNDDGTISITGAGVAKSFNALAFASVAFANDGRIKDAIFSGIAVNAKDSSVSFSLSATLDPKTIAFSP